MKKILIYVFFLSFLNWPVVSAQSISEAQIAVGVMMRDLSLFDNPFPARVHISLERTDAHYDVYKFILAHDGVGPIHLLAKGPKGFLTRPQTPLRALMIASGFFTGEDSIHLIGDFPDRVVIGYEYPYSLEHFQKDPGTVLQFVRKTPGQIAVALNWLSRQPWLVPNGLSVMGVSLGGVFLPSSLHISQALGVRLEKSIFVCTSADMRAILKANLSTYIDSSILDYLIALALMPTQVMDPQMHLPFLNGPFLVIQTDKDTVIPASSQDSFFKRLREPKTEVVLPGPHVNSDQVELIQKIQSAVLQSFAN